MGLSNDEKQLLSNGIANIVTECVKTKKIDVIFIDVIKDAESAGMQIITLSVVYKDWINFEEQRKINDLIMLLQEKMNLNIKLDYKFSDDYGLYDLCNYRIPKENSYYQFCLGEILYINSERFRYLQELSRKNSKQESTVVSILPIGDIKKLLRTKSETPSRVA